VTGVTVALLAVGLFAAGIGTMVFLRTAQITAIDEQLRSIVSTDLTSTLMTVDVEDGVPTFRVDAAAAPTPYFVAVYAPEGDLLATAGGSGGLPPEFPPSFPLQKTIIEGTAPFELASVDGSRAFHASVDVLQLPGVRESQTQLVAIPLSSVNQTVANFIGIYTILALLTIIGGALLTRWLVTLTFRGLGQVEDTAMSIAAGDFRQRMTDIAPGTEVGRLKTAINAMLDRIDRALGQRDATVQQMRRFIGDASHELRTPLVTVRGYAELYRMGAIADTEQTAQAMERIEKEAIRMGALVEDLLALARLDERRDLVIQPIDLRPIARDAVLDMRATAPDRAVALVEVDGGTVSRPSSDSSPPTEPIAARRRAPGGGGLAGATLSLLRRRPRSTPEKLPPGVALTQPITTPPAPPLPAPRLEPIVLGDENRIRQVVANLLGNARRYTPAGSPIDVAVGVDRAYGMGWIAVVDHGEGVPEQIREKIFQRFWRADSSRTRETGGSGLGLSIVASIVDALHGSIDVTETPGGGATFRIAFPLAEARDAAEHLLIETQPLQRLHLEE